MRKLNKFRLFVFVSVIIGASYMELSKDYRKHKEKEKWINQESAEYQKNKKLVKNNKIGASAQQ